MEGEVSPQTERLHGGGVGLPSTPRHPLTFRADTVQGGACFQDLGVWVPLPMPGVCTVPQPSPTPVGSLTPCSCPHGDDPALGKGHVSFPPLHVTPVTTF